MKERCAMEQKEQAPSGGDGAGELDAAMRRVNALEAELDSARGAKRQFDEAMDDLAEDARHFKKWQEDMAELLRGDKIGLARLEGMRIAVFERERASSEMRNDAIKKGSLSLKGLQGEYESAYRDFRRLAIGE